MARNARVTNPRAMTQNSDALRTAHTTALQQQGGNISRTLHRYIVTTMRHSELVSVEFELIACAPRMIPGRPLVPRPLPLHPISSTAFPHPDTSERFPSSPSQVYLWRGAVGKPDTP